MLPLPVVLAAALFTFTPTGNTTFAGRIVTGDTAVAAPKIVFAIEPDARIFVNGLSGWTCTTTTNPVECTIASLPAHYGEDFTVNILGNPGRYTIAATYEQQRIAVPAAIPRVFALASGLSFGDAVVAANQQCTDDVPCIIDFTFNPETGQLRFTPGTLPIITACNITLFSPRRPPDLSDLKHIIEGTALHFQPACENAHVTVSGLQLTSANTRGIYVDAPGAEVRIERMEIANTGRSAITIWNAANTVIDTVDARQSRASAVFAGPNAGAIVIRNSTLTNHAHFGVALANDATKLTLENTRIFGNTAGDVDWGLDGPTDRVPVILAKTANSITVDPRGAGVVEVWASDSLTMFGNAGLEFFVGRAETHGEAVTISLANEARGKWLSAIRVEAGRVSDVSGGVGR
jgi:hypothetical protein